MVSKRFSEFRFLKEKAGNYRAVLTKYTKKTLNSNIVVSAVLFFAAYFYFAVTFKLESFIYLSPFVFFYLFVIFWKTLKEKKVMDEPERLLISPKFASYTLFLILIFFLAYFLDKIGE